MSTVISDYGTLSSGAFDMSNANRINDLFNAKVNNGGPPNFPSPVGDDSKTTDEVIPRDMYYDGALVADRYSDDNELGPFIDIYQDNKLQDSLVKLDKLALRRIAVRGREYRGAPGEMLVSVDPSTTTTSSSTTDSGISVLLWIVVIIGGISLIASATGREVEL